MTKYIFILILFGLGLQANSVDDALASAKAGHFATAEKLLTQACAREDIRGCYKLGVMYDRGQGLPQNDKTAVRLYRKACDGGNANGCFNLGMMYEKGRGVQQDYRGAAHHYKRACDKGDT